MGLASQAIRLRRTSWEDKIQALSEELYLILLTDKDYEVGEMNITFPDDPNGLVLPERVLRNPFGEFEFPDLMFPELILPFQQPTFSDITVPEPDPRDGNTSTIKKTRTKTRIIHQRAAMPARITGGSGPRYDAQIYPNGSTGPAKSSPTSTDSSGNVSGGILDLNHDPNEDPKEAGTWVLAFRHLEIEFEVREFVEISAYGEETILKTETRARIIQDNREFTEAGAGGGGNAFAGYVVSGTGFTYVVRIFTEAGTKDVTVTQLQIHGSETIPAGTGCIVVKTGSVYYMQVPVWLGS